LSFIIIISFIRQQSVTQINCQRFTFNLPVPFALIRKWEHTRTLVWKDCAWWFVSRNFLW